MAAVAYDESLREWARTDLDDLRHVLADLISLTERIFVIEDEVRSEVIGELHQLCQDATTKAIDADSRLVLYVDCLPDVWSDEAAICVTDMKTGAINGDVQRVEQAARRIMAKICDIESAIKQICGPEFQLSSALAPWPSAKKTYHYRATGLCVCMMNLANWERSRTESGGRIDPLTWLINSRETIRELVMNLQSGFQLCAEVQILSVDRKPVRVGHSLAYNELEVHPSYHKAAYMIAQTVLSSLWGGVFDDDQEWFCDAELPDRVANSINAENLGERTANIAWLKDLDWGLIENGLPGEFDLIRDGMEREFSNHRTRRPQATACGDTTEEQNNYRDGAWFTRNTAISPSRLRMAAATNRKTKRVRCMDRDGVKLYSLVDAEKHWPDDFTEKGATQRKPAQI